MKRRMLFGLLFFSCMRLVAQSPADEENVVISDALREFEFTKGNSQSPVLVKEKSTRSYYCMNFRTDIPVAEFYNDIESIDDVSITVDGSKKHGIKPRYEYHNVDGIFYSDAHVCFFSLPLAKKGSTSKVTIEKTISDPHYFTKIFLMESQAIKQQQVRVVVPEWMNVELKEFNFEGYAITKSIEQKGTEKVYIYTMKNIPAATRESSAPGSTYYMPHLLVMTKSAAPKGEQLTYFKTLADQYKWYNGLVKQVDNDKAIMKKKADEITAGLQSDEEKARAIYLWVQDNVRYIAFEDGIAGFRPEKAQEVLARKYGDCKGMANLATQLLKAAGLDARLCWIGTRHLAYDYSTPSLAVDNHMISVWMNKGVPVYLDATEKYIGMGEVAERIQGRQTLIADGDKFILGKVPVNNHFQNTSKEIRYLKLEGTDLKGRVEHSWKGENKVWLLSQLYSMKSDKQSTAMRDYLSEGNKKFKMDSFSVLNIADYNKDLAASYQLVWQDRVSSFGEESYVELDNRRSMEGFRFNLDKRKLPYWFDFKNHLVFETHLELPQDKKATNLPGNIDIRQKGYQFSGSYSATGNKVVYRVEIIIEQPELAVQQLDQWNKDIDQLKKFYNQQLTIVKK